jgi:hypothetical protein
MPASDELRSTTAVEVFRSSGPTQVERVFVAFGTSGGAQTQTVTFARGGIDFRSFALTSIVGTIDITLPTPLAVAAGEAITARVSSATARSVLYRIEARGT